MRIFRVTFIEPPREKGKPRSTFSVDVAAPSRQEAMPRAIEMCASTQPGWYLKSVKDLGAAGIAA